MNQGGTAKMRSYPFQIGELPGYVLFDYANPHSAGELIANPNPVELKPLTEDYSFSLEEIPLGYNNLLIRVFDQIVLVDAGIRRPMGELFLALGEVGVEPDEIDVIIITHSDRDHIGGILDMEGNLSFPNACYSILEDAWRWWSSPEQRSLLTERNQWEKDKTEFGWDTYSKIIDLLNPVRAGEEILPGITLSMAAGHRIDHSILDVRSGDQSLVHLADAVVHPLFMANAGWYSTYDSDPIQAIESKKILLNRCAAGKSLVFGAHFPFPGLGYVQVAGDHSWLWQPVQAAKQVSSPGY